MLDAVTAFPFNDAVAPAGGAPHGANLDTPAADDAGWQARLALRFATRSVTDSATYMASCRHVGPLRIQKTLFPEGPGICHALIVHPPAGIAGGDTLRIDVTLDAHAHAVLSTPGATKWYKANGRRAAQHLRFRVADGARLDWLPQNNIVFDHARADMSVHVEIAADASAIGWDACLLGRQAAGETWRDADLHADVRLQRPDGTLLWAEQAVFSSDDAIRLSAQGLDGWTSFGTLWAVVPAARAAGLAEHAVVEDVRAMLPFDDTMRAGLTCLPDGVVLIRVTAQRMEALQQLLTQCWTALRPLIHGVPARPLRIWRT
ncbi:urease accessory protein UreD [Robbsia sp. KACC 23696]|uniref:urease accessory protein UreD n=1 Tax=Robbsia sp. KACC 23696 TaxID=3149231 RepID=UPI00325A63E3